MTAAPTDITRASLHGITGDNHDRERLVVSFDTPDGTVTRLSMTIKDLETLGELVEFVKPQLAANWRKRDEAQR